eukprot:scaffold938_cov334-Pavlova_lutheri.AAC.57
MPVLEQRLAIHEGFAFFAFHGTVLAHRAWAFLRAFESRFCNCPRASRTSNKTQSCPLAAASGSNGLASSHLFHPSVIQHSCDGTVGWHSSFDPSHRCTMVPLLH